MSDNDSKTKMNPEIKAQWVTALRSGEYQQGDGALCDGGMYCCLGVLTDLAVKAGAQPAGEPASPHGAQIQFPTMIEVYDEDGGVKLEPNLEGGLTPTFTMKWASLPEPNPSVIAPDGEPHGLAGLNDNGVTFAELADMIEASL